jgi:hypothetical protein
MKNKKFIYMTVHHLPTGKIFKSKEAEWNINIERDMNQLGEMINKLDHIKFQCNDSTKYIPRSVLKQSVLDIITYIED